MSAAGDIAGDRHVVRLVGQNEADRTDRPPSIERVPLDRSRRRKSCDDAEIENIARTCHRDRVGVGLKGPRFDAVDLVANQI